jgi:phospholipid/cholesterol/gamma-HCH transport system substrate-binding protein
MNKKINNATNNAVLGLFFVGVIAVLSWFTLFQSDFSMGGESGKGTVWFANAGGLRSGDPVLVAGVRWGKVEKVTFDATISATERRIQVELTLDAPVQLFTDHAITISDATVLGGKNLSIEPGSPLSKPFEGEWMGTTRPDVLSTLGSVLEENRESLREAVDGLAEVVRNIQDGKGVIGALVTDEALRQSLGDAVSSIEGTFSQLEETSRQINRGEGTIGRLIFDAALAQRIDNASASMETLLADAQQAITEAREGKGTIGALLTDEVMAEDLRATLSDLASVTGRLADGEGTIGKLLTDPKIAQDIETLTDALANGDGTLGRLILEPEVYNNMLSITDDMKTFSKALASGEGTISRMVYDDTLYLEIDRALGVLTGTLEEAREAAPISTFLNAIFLGF